MTLRIITDSTSDLPPDLAAQLGIVIVPCFINIGEQSFLDGIDLSRQEFYARLPTYAPFPKTAAPGIELFHQAYRQVIHEGATEILSIHVASSLSAVYNVAMIAAQEMNDAPITVFDSRQLSLGTGFQAMIAAQLAAAGFSIAEIVRRLDEKILHIHAMAVLDTLEFLRRGGRVSRLVSSLGSLLHIKPVMHVYNGEVNAERVRSRKTAVARMLDIAQASAPFEQLAIVHTHAPALAEELRQHVQTVFPSTDISLCVEVTPVIGAHLGPDAVGLIYIGAK
jgi:DegV family protein with EDD domain